MALPSVSREVGCRSALGHSQDEKVCGERLSSPPVLSEIVKRRFVRVPYPEPGPGRSITFRKRPGGDGCGSSPGTLNSRHLIGPLTAASEPISRSWSFCANSIFHWMGIGNENDQVS